MGGDVVHISNSSEPPSFHVDVGRIKRRRALDLFSGTGSVRDVLKEGGWDVVTLDFNPKWGSDIVVDILAWDYTVFPRNYFDLVTASPPCIEFSRALTTRERKLALADKLVQKVLEIVKYFNPRWWWIENPQTGELKSRWYMAELAFVDIDYCQFSEWGYRKPTRFWGVFPGGELANVTCDGYNCKNLLGPPSRVGGPRRHRIQLSGRENFPGSEYQYRIPPGVVKYLMGWRPKGGDESLQHPLLKAVTRIGSPGYVQSSDPIRACGERQLTMRVRAQDAFGNVQYLEMLVDTGAEANLLSKNLFAGGSWRKSPNPLNLLTVAGEKLGGGDQEIRLDLTFGLEGGDGTWSSHGVFYSANIHVDGILSFPWLRERGLLVCSQTGCLALEAELGSAQRITGVDDGADGVESEGSVDEMEIDSVQKFPFQFAVPVEFEQGPDELLSRNENRFIQKVLRNAKDTQVVVGSVVEARFPLQCAGIEVAKESLREDYGGTVFKDRVSPNPPKRGPQGEAVIEIKPGSEAKKTKANSTVWRKT